MGITKKYSPISNYYSNSIYIMILIKILVLNSIVHGESDQKEIFGTVKVNSGIHVAKVKAVSCIDNSCWKTVENECVVDPKCFDLKCINGVIIKFKKGVLFQDEDKDLSGKKDI